MNNDDYTDWLLEIVQAYDRAKQDPSSLVSVDQVRKRLAAQHQGASDQCGDDADFYPASLLVESKIYSLASDYIITKVSPAKLSNFYDWEQYL